MANCVRCGKESNGSFCPSCQKGWNLCECGKVKKRNVAQCKECRPIPSTSFCKKCGKHIGTKPYKVCKGCMKNHFWTEHEDNFIRQYYAIHGAKWCAQKLGLSQATIRERASELEVHLTPKAYRRIVFGAAIEANTGRERTPEFTEACRQRALKRLDFFKEQLIKGRLANQVKNPSRLERKLWAILDILGVEYDTQVLIKKSFIVDAQVGQTIIEADGDWWHGHPRFEPLREQQKKQQKRDRAKDKYLITCGYTVIRIWESDMSLESVAAALGMDAPLIQLTFSFLANH